MSRLTSLPADSQAPSRSAKAAMTKQARREAAEREAQEALNQPRRKYLRYVV